MSQIAAVANLSKFLSVAKSAKGKGVPLPIWDHDITALESAVKALADVRAAVIEECAKVAERETCKMKCASPDCLTARRIAGEIRDLSTLTR